MHLRLKASVAGFVLALCMTACDSTTLNQNRDITVRNDSTNHLDWAKVTWGHGQLNVGTMMPGTGSTFFYFNLPVGVTTNIAFIEFINEDAPGLNWSSGSNAEVRARRANASMRVPVDVSQLLHLGPEHYHITFRILSLTNADVFVEKK